MATSDRDCQTIEAGVWWGTVVELDSSPLAPRASSTMNHRPRSVAGLLALVAFSLFLAEGIWTAVCPPESGDAAVVAMTSGASAEAAPESSDHERAGSEEDPGCPLGVVAIGGCVSAAVLSAAPPTPSILNAGAEPSLVVEVRPDLLLSSSLFRPPRA